MKTTYLLIALCLNTYYAMAQDYALQFDGSNQMVQGYFSLFTDVYNNFTMELWVYPTATHEIDQESTSGNAGLSGQRWAIGPQCPPSENYAGAGISVGTNGVSVYEQSYLGMPAVLVWNGNISGWTHIAVVYQNRTPKLYINGQLVRTGLTSTIPQAHPSTKEIGGEWYGYYAGALDEYRAWDIPLTAQQITEYMNRQINSSDQLWNNCLVYIPFREGTGTTTNDIGPGNIPHEAQLINNPVWVGGCFNQSPIIRRHPSGAIRCVAESVTFDVSAIGNMGTSITYQWRKNATDISGATSSSYTIPSVIMSDAGSYDVVVNSSNSASTISSAAILSVITYYGTTQDFALQFNGSNQMVQGYFSLFNDVYNNFTMEFWAYPTATHEIDVESTSGNAGLSGQRWAIGPQSPPSENYAGAGISVGTNGVSVYEQSYLGMPAVLVWNGNISGCTHIAVVYQNRTPKLYINGQLVRTGLTSTIQRVHPSSKEIGGEWYGYYAGALDEFRVWDIPLTAEQIMENMNHQITSSDVLWNHCSIDLPFQEGNGTTTADVGPVDLPHVADLVNNPLWIGGRFNQSPIITSHPESAIRCVGESVTFDVSAIGNMGKSITYQWRKNAADISGATSSSYAIQTVTQDDAGSYNVIVSGLCLTPATSSAATLTVNHLPDITLNPVSKTVIAGNNVTFTASSSGAPTPAVQWQRSTDGGETWTDISGATSTSLTIANVPISRNGDAYHAVFTNSCGSTTSADATLQVKLVLADLGPAEICLTGSAQSNGCWWHHRNCNHKVDIKVEFFKNGTTTADRILQGELRKQQITGHPEHNYAKHYKIPLPNMNNITFGAEDYLYCRVLVRRNGGSGDFPVKMWFNGSPHGNSCNDEDEPEPKAWSRIHKVTYGGSTQNYYYFRDGEGDYRPFATSHGSNSESIQVTATTSYQEIGTWRIAGAQMKRDAQENSGGTIPNSVLLSNYPNPFNPATTIIYDIPQDGSVVLRIYDVYGRLIAQPVNGWRAAGSYAVEFDGRGLPGGIYISRLEAGGEVRSSTMTLAK